MEDIAIPQCFKSKCLGATGYNPRNHRLVSLKKSERKPGGAIVFALDAIAPEQKEAQAARQQALKDLEEENKVLLEKIRQIRGGQ